MSHYYDTADTSDMLNNSRKRGDQSLPKIKTYD